MGKRQKQKKPSNLSATVRGTLSNIGRDLTISWDQTKVDDAHIPSRLSICRSSATRWSSGPWDPPDLNSAILQPLNPHHFTILSSAQPNIPAFSMGSTSVFAKVRS
ncbi:hypothetical protein ACN38_g7425 [Penicillium nordicum]|uniref:Uncharacterized protein n=1 Tax=Penicillium nordicum TaxID=229535 RepID=A0A0M8P6I6_9EURO|nr:hypothetical protein ACN38_g7425 [Penicillium nordicum]